MMTDPAEVARECLAAALRYLDYCSACQFCEAGHVSTDDGGDAPHTEECPLYGYDETKDIRRLQAWLRSPHDPTKETK